MIIHFTRLRLKNFLSTGNAIQEIILDESMLTLILGLIPEADGGMKNGAGKTTILQAVCYALFGKPLTKIKIPNLVNNLNKKAMTVALDFEVGDKKYTIERGQKPAFLRFFVDDKEIKQEGSSTDDALGENRFTQTEINRIIGMSHLMFKHIVGLNTFTDPFLREKEAVQREIIEELLGITQISLRAERLRSIMVTTKDAIKEQEAHIKATTEANNRIETTLRNLEATERTWVSKHLSEIDRLTADIAALGQIDYEAALMAFDAQEAWDARQRDISERTAPVTGLYEQSKRSIEALDREMARMGSPAATSTANARTLREVERKQSDIAKHEAFIMATNTAIAKLRTDQDQDDAICSCCGQALAGTDHLAQVKATIGASIRNHAVDIGNRERSIADLHAEIAAIQQEAAHADEEAQKQAAERTARKSVLEHERTEHIVKRDAYAGEIAQLRIETVALGVRPAVMFSSRDELYETRSISTVLERDLENETKKTNPYVDQIVAIRETLQKIDYTLLNDHTSALKHQDFLMKLLTSKDSFIRKKIVDQNLPYLNTRIAHYLTALTLPHAVVFQSDLTVEINHLGNDYDFEQLSRGEMNRVIMATAFAFRDVWENLNNPINLLWVDELLDQGTCTPGVEQALGILQDMGIKRGKNIFLVSHKDELRGRINDVLLCNKTKDFTTFEVGESA